jgi:hypothetical protein
MRTGTSKILEETMKKSTLFISAALTAFVLVVLAGVVMTFKNTTAAAAPVSAATSAPVVADVLPTSAPVLPTTAPTVAPTPVGPLEAAGIASKFLNKTDVYSVESTTLNGANVFLVTFSSGDLVYVGLDGTVISTSKVQPTVLSYAPAPLPTPKPHKKNNGGGGGITPPPGGGDGGGEGGD